MQTTLLGLALALILALIAALIGPYFIDWNQFRAQFEAEATRAIGAQVRVGGALDARLLPTPTLRLRSVVVGGANDPGRVRADKLDVEFSLGSLMRGEWRADELTINGFALDLGLDAQGRLDWPASGLSNLSALTVDRLNLTGRVALHDAASRTNLELNDIAFSGELRALAGSLRGDGNFMLAGTRYPFRLSSGRPADGNGTRLHLTVDPGARALAVDLDGLLTFEARSPRFDGAMTLAAPAPPKANAADTPRAPWRVSSRIKADPAAAKLEQLEASYGVDERSLKLVGAADLRFGATPRLHAVLSARQLDVDRLLGGDDGGGQTVSWLPRLRNLAAAIPQAALATEIEVSADQIMLGGRPIQNFAADLRSDTHAWVVDRLDFRAPGGSQLVLSDGVALPGAPDGFKATLSLDSADPDLLAAWLQGRGDNIGRLQKPLRARGEISMASGGIAIDALKAELDGGTLEGRLAYSDRAKDHGSHLDATLKADRLDLEAASAIVRSLAGPTAEWPDEAVLALDIGRAAAWGQTLQPLVARVAYGPAAMTLDQLKIGAAGGLMIEGTGAFERASATGKLTLNATSASLGQLAGAIDPLAPAIAARLNAAGQPMGAARASLTLALDRNEAQPDRANAGVVVEIDAPQLRGSASFIAKPPIADIRGFNFEALARSEINVETKLAAERGQSLLALLGFDRALAAGEGGARLDASATGVWRAPLRLKARLVGADLDAELEGGVEPWAAAPKATLNLKARHLNLAPLLQFGASDASLAKISLSSRLDLADNRLTFNNVDLGVAGSRVRGRVAVSLGDDTEVEGEAGIDVLELAPAFRLAVGAAGRDPTEPLGRVLLRGWRGRLAFQALRGILPGGSELQPFSGAIRNDGQTLTIESAGKVGGGDARADVTIGQSDNGLALNAQLRLAGADGAALRYRGLAMPAGRVSMQMTLDGIGRSASALSGALSGGGSVTLESARIAGLDGQVFDTAIRASDAGQPIDDARLGQIVAPVLAAGSLPIETAQLPFSLKDGQLRFAPVTLESPGARAVVAGGYDLLADQTDIRATLVSTRAGAGALRPEIRIFAVGSPDALHRSVDVAALSSWLAVRRIDRETQKLESLERDATPPAAVPAAIPPAELPKATEPSVTEKPDASLAPPPDLPAPNAPVPGRDLRRILPKPRLLAPRPLDLPEAARAPVAPESAAPLPPPIEIRPAPGASRPQKLRPPLVLTPPASPRAAN